MAKEEFKRDVFWYHVGDEHTTITGRAITGNSPESDTPFQVHHSYPLRYAMVSLQTEVVSALRRKGAQAKPEAGTIRPFDAIVHAAAILRSEIDHEPEDEDLALGPRGWRDWTIFADPQPIFECIYDSSALLQPGSGWTYGDVCGLLSLWCIDEAIARIEADEPYKAAVWAGYAHRYAQWQIGDAVNASGEGQRQLAALFSQRGLDQRHAANREAKAHARELYQAKKWPSKAEAARRIAAQVNRTEKVVERWIREFERVRDMLTKGGEEGRPLCP